MHTRVLPHVDLSRIFPLQGRWSTPRPSGGGATVPRRSSRRSKAFRQSTLDETGETGDDDNSSESLSIGGDGGGAGGDTSGTARIDTVSHLRSTSVKRLDLTGNTFGIDGARALGWYIPLFIRSQFCACRVHQSDLAFVQHFSCLIFSSML